MSKKLVVLLVGLVVLLIIGLGVVVIGLQGIDRESQQALDWNRITVEEGGYSVLIPGEPKIKTWVVDTTNLGKINFNMNFSEGVKSLFYSNGFAVIISNVPAQSLIEDTLAERLDRAKGGVGLFAQGAKAVEEKK